MQPNYTKICLGLFSVYGEKLWREGEGRVSYRAMLGPLTSVEIVEPFVTIISVIVSCRSVCKLQLLFLPRLQ